MKTGYTDIVIEMSQKLYQALLQQEPDLAQKVHEVDGEVNKILRRVGFFVVSLVLAELSTQVTKEARATGNHTSSVENKILLPVWRCRNAIPLPIAVADGGNGLQESLEKQFPRLTFILDRPHLKAHLYAGAPSDGTNGL